MALLFSLLQIIKRTAEQIKNIQATGNEHMDYGVHSLMQSNGIPQYKIVSAFPVQLQ
jgi:hypothetical protein